MLTLKEINLWMRFHQKRLRYGDLIPTISEIADQAGLSRQTLYAVLNNERSEFGEIAQIRLSRVIERISSQPSYQNSRIHRIDMSTDVPKIRFGL